MSHEGLVGIVALLSVCSLFAPTPSLAANQSLTITAAGSYVCDSAGATDACIVDCQGSDLKGAIVDCGNAGECRVQCSTNNACFSSGTLYANNSQSLLITSASVDDCFKTQGKIYLPHSGNATLLNAPGRRTYREAIIYAGPDTQHIHINCDGNGADDCKNMEVHAETAQYLEITVGDGSSELDSDGNAGGIYCPQNSNYQGPEIAPCIVEVNAAGAGINGVIFHALNGVPKDLWFKGSGDAFVGSHSSLICTAGTDTLFKDVTTLPLTPNDLPNCWNTESPTADPTKSPSKSPSHIPSKSPSNQPSDSPSKSPSEPTTKSPSASPTTRNPTASPSKNPSRSPTTSPSRDPSKSPTGSPSSTPSASPSRSPSEFPSAAPSKSPQQVLVVQPTPKPDDAADTSTVSPFIDTQIANTLKDASSATGSQQQSNGLVLLVGILSAVIFVLVAILVYQKCKRSKAKQQSIGAPSAEPKKVKLHPVPVASQSPRSQELSPSIDLESATKRDTGIKHVQQAKRQQNFREDSKSHQSSGSDGMYRAAKHVQTTTGTGGFITEDGSGDSDSDSDSADPSPQRNRNKVTSKGTQGGQASVKEVEMHSNRALQGQHRDGDEQTGNEHPMGVLLTGKGDGNMDNVNLVEPKAPTERSASNEQDEMIHDELTKNNPDEETAYIDY